MLDMTHAQGWRKNSRWIGREERTRKIAIGICMAGFALAFLAMAALEHGSQVWAWLVRAL